MFIKVLMKLLNRNCPSKVMKFILKHKKLGTLKFVLINTHKEIFENSAIFFLKFQASDNSGV